MQVQLHYMCKLTCECQLKSVNVDTWFHVGHGEHLQGQSPVFDTSFHADPLPLWTLLLFILRLHSH